MSSKKTNGRPQVMTYPCKLITQQHNLMTLKERLRKAFRQKGYHTEK
uniref:Uncharacterized protein n=1 Tax=Arundo donax TaxID=35708 RepID=A0A0A9BGM8_ARUDO